MSIGEVVLQVVERMVIPDPGFDHYTPVPLRGGLEEFVDPWRDSLVSGLSSGVLVGGGTAGVPD